MPHRTARACAALALAVLVAVPGTGVARAADPAPTPAPDGTSGWAEGRVLVGYAKGSTKAERKLARQAAKVRRARALDGLPDVEVVETSMPVGEAIGRLKGAKGVRYAQPDYIVQADYVPDDPRLADQWGLAQANGVDIGAKAAWDVTTGSPSVVVAVIDSGVMLDHPDLAANIWTNPDEIAGNGIDDDDDGYVDDVHGWDFVDDDNDPSDENRHGTHVAGTIAAVGDNGIGVAGVAYGSRILPLRMLNAGGSGLLSDGVRALAYARAHGARVTNLSWTYSGAISQPLWDELESDAAGGMVVTAAAGNQGFDADVTPMYPAAFDLPGIVSVAALGPDGTLPDFSNRGVASVDIAAPGVDILSTWFNGGYDTLTGTSMAAPHVAGVAALLLSAHPGWTAAQVRDRLLETARPRGALFGVIGTGGSLDAAAALGTGTNRAPDVHITAPATDARVLPGGPVTLTATAVDPEDGNVAATISWHSSLQGPLGTGPSITRSDLEVGTHLIAATARDAGGHRRSATLILQVTPPVSFVDEHPEPHPASIAVAPDGTPVVTWSEDGVGTVVGREEGSWSREVVSASYSDVWSDALVDPSGTVHVAIQRQWKDIGADSDGGILVASDDGSGAGTGWTLERVTEGCGDDAEGCGIDTAPSIARDASGRLQVAWSRIPIPNAFVVGNRPGLWHAVSHAVGPWTTQRVLDAEDVLLPDLATAPDGSAHIVFWRNGGDADGLYHASDETGDWVIDEIAALPDDGLIGTPSVQAGAAGGVDVAWAGSGGVVVRSRVSGSWEAPVVVSADAATDVDLVRDGGSLHLAFARVDGTGNPAGVGYALDDGSGWVVGTVDAGQDQHPRLAVDAAGHPHVSYLRAFPEHEVRHATDAGAGWSTDVVTHGWTWTEPSVGVDAAGHHHVAVGRTGTEPGVWYATDASGSWSLERLTTEPPDGPVALVVAPDGAVAIGSAERFDAAGALVGDPAVWLRTGMAGAWATRRVGSNTGGAGVALARSSTGRLYIGWSTDVAGQVRIAVATNASGTWATSYATPGAAATVDTSPSIAVDPAGKVHLVYEERTPATSAVAIRYATDASGAWVRTLLASGSSPRIQPRIALTPAGAPRVVYWVLDAVNGGSLGIRLASRSGTTWATSTVSSNRYDTSPAVAVDAQGHAHLLWERRVGYAICSSPFCPAAPGLRHWTDAPDAPRPDRVTDYADDAYPALVRGADGGVYGVFAAPAWRLGVIDLWAPTPTVSRPSIHLAASGTVKAGTSLLSVVFTGRHAATYRLDQRLGTGAWHTVGSQTGATTRTVAVSQSTTIVRTFRVSAFDGLGRAGTTGTGATFRTWGHSEVPGSGVAYTGSWRIARNASFWGGAARYATARSASVSWTVTAKEVAVTALRTPASGSARIYIDGKQVATVSLAGRTAYRQLVYRRTFTGTAKHRITIKPAGNGRVTVDGFLALR